MINENGEVRYKRKERWLLEVVREENGYVFLKEMQPRPLVKLTKEEYEKLRKPKIVVETHEADYTYNAKSGL